MTIAHWSSRYETGIGLIDAQHQALFAAVNRLGEAFTTGTAGFQARESLDFLAQYAVDHFQAEEQFMKEMGFPGLEAHAVEHTHLLQEVCGLQDRLAQGRPVTMEVTIFLADWLKHHIHESDMGYVRFMQERNLA
jgi:hemerythrin